MKKMILLPMFCLLSQVSYAEGFRCVENPNDAQTQHRNQMAVKLTTLQKITDHRIVGQNDYAEYVKVEIFSRDSKMSGARFSRIRAPFLAVAKSSEVQYDIDAWKEQGFQMGIYMDEPGQNWIKLMGFKGSARLNCDIFN